MACRLVAIEKNPGVQPLGIGDTIQRDIAKLVLRATGDQAKVASRKMQLCSGI